MIDINTLTELYFATDEPVPYKLKYNNTEILIHPIKVRNWSEFSSCMDCISYDRAELNDVDIIRMSYLEFLFYLHKNGDKIINLYSLSVILKYSLMENLISMEEENGKPRLAILDETTKMEIDGSIKAEIKYLITPNEFDEIRKIILFQNMSDYDDVELSPDVKKIMEDYYSLVNNGTRKVATEEKMCLVGNSSGLSKKEILSMTYRDFDMRFNLLIDEIEYKINKSAELNGVTFKTKTEHFMFKKKKDKLSQFFVDSTDLGETIGNPNGV